MQDVIAFSKIIDALKETRDICVENNHDNCSRTTLCKGADGAWELYPGVGARVEHNGEIDEDGDLPFSLPHVAGDMTDEQIETVAISWKDGDYREYLRFPDTLLIVEDEEKYD